ncbi:MAG: hypothetical protein ACOCTI_04405 [Phycisphaeraceae bacterium]
MAAMFRKFGINGLRHHKHLDGAGWHGFQSETSFVEFEPEGLDRFDYFNKCLKDAGVFILHSPTFGVRFGRDDVDRIPYWQELGSFGDKPGDRIRAGYGLVYLAKEIQDLQIEQTVKLLEHRNPYTGTRYADDPQLFCVEMFNEDSVLFSGTNSSLQRTPTIRQRVARQFSDWLLEKYGSESAWREAWGDEMVISDPEHIQFVHLRNRVAPDKVQGELPAESLEQGTVVPWASPWFNDAAMKPGSDQAPMKQRLLDTMVFLIGLQNEFYERFEQAVRETGFDGEFVTSNWQAGSLVGHLLNLHSDAQTGIVDRHNYFGGPFQAMDGSRTFRRTSMLNQPGSGNLSVGFQQVDDAAFMLSEWIHVQPNPWYAEGPVIMGAYGWGLQGWDASYFFQMGSTRGQISPRLGVNPWDASNPLGLATFPVVSRMVRRLDVAESDETKHLNVHLPSLKQGEMSFRGTTVQNHDEKVFSTDKVPPEALAATRVAVRFTDSWQETPAFDMTPYLDGETVVSATEELRWTPGEENDPSSGYCIINTGGTKGFVGFAPGGETFNLGDGFAVTPEQGFAVILLSAQGRDEVLATADRIVVTAVARGRNTGMQLSDEKNRIVKAGQAPLLMEPVRAQVTTPFDAQLDVLDHDGIQATASRAVEGGFVIDGSEDRTPFYLIRR